MPRVVAEPVNLCCIGVDLNGQMSEVLLLKEVPSKEVYDSIINQTLPPPGHVSAADAADISTNTDSATPASSSGSSVKAPRFLAVYHPSRCRGNTVVDIHSGLNGTLGPATRPWTLCGPQQAITSIGGVQTLLPLFRSLVEVVDPSQAPANSPLSGGENGYHTHATPLDLTPSLRVHLTASPGSPLSNPASSPTDNLNPVDPADPSAVSFQPRLNSAESTNLPHVPLMRQDLEGNIATRLSILANFLDKQGGVGRNPLNHNSCHPPTTGPTTASITAALTTATTLPSLLLQVPSQHQLYQVRGVEMIEYVEHPPSTHPPHIIIIIIIPHQPCRKQSLPITTPVHLTTTPGIASVMFSLLNYTLSPLSRALKRCAG